MTRKLTITTILTTLALAGSLAACAPSAEISDPPADQPTKEAPAEEPAAEETKAEEPPAAEVGTRENPAAIGQVVTFTDTVSNEALWEVSLSNPTLDASAAVAAANQFNEPAPEGMVYAMVTVNVKRLGAEAATPQFDLTVEYVSAAGTTHKAYDASVVEPEPTFSGLNEMYAGATGSGNVIIAIPANDGGAGAWTVAPLFGDPTFFKAV